MLSSRWSWSFLLSALLIGTSTTSEPETKSEQGGKLVFQHGPQGVKRLPDIYWNTTNPIFRIDNTDHIMDVNEGSTGSPFEYDQVNIICPLYDQRQSPNEVDTEKFIIYHVNKEEYDTCRIMSAHPRIIANCDKPYSLRYFTISFRSFSPTPGALEFHSGTDYFFISTSSQSDLHRRVDGMCRSHNMKMVFKVADKQKKQKITPADGPVNTIIGNEKTFGEKLEPTKLETKQPKGLQRPDQDFEGRNTDKDLADKTPITFTSRSDDLENQVLVDEDRRERNGDFVSRKEPKSLDYYLYQTRTNSISNGLDENKRTKSSGAFKQEASTGSAASTTPTTSIKLKLHFLLLLSFTLMVRLQQ